MLRLLKSEKFTLIALLVAVVAFPLEHTLTGHGQTVALIAAAVLIATIVLAAVRVAHHAEVLAEKVGEPYGTMILTLAAVLVEVVILVIVTGHTHSKTLARDTIYSAVMLDINGILGISAILGGLRFGEQPYNVDSGNTYIVMIISAIGGAMIIPAFLPAEHQFAYSVFSVIGLGFLYTIFLRLQTTRHSYFFSYNYAETGSTGHTHPGKTATSVALLIAGVAVIGLLAEVMAGTMDAGLRGTGVPAGVAAMVVAGISASPEILTAVRAALSNRMQPVVNIALGASLSTVILTVPVILVIGLLSGHAPVMALTPVQIAMIALTAVAAMINLHDGETNAIEGSTHFFLFAAFLVLTALGV